jgi:hypothetical protein
MASLAQNASPGSRSLQSASGALQIPTSGPGVELQNWPLGQV